MGNTHSQEATATLQTCLQSVCNGQLGCVAFAGDLLYQEAWVKPYNLAWDVTPAAVVRPQTAQDVSAIVKCAAQFDVKVQAKSGGHSYANFGTGGADGAVMIDLVNFQKFVMDNTTWQATVGPGTHLGDLTTKMHNAGGRAMAHGVCPGVGLGGHATIGGLGPMSRMWGSCLDHVVEVEVVTADGAIQRANPTNNSDLFWALKGAASGFGVITEFVLRTHPEPGDVVQYTSVLSFGKQADMASVYQQWQDLVFDTTLDRRFGTEFIMQPLGAIITGTFYGTKDEYLASGIPARLPNGGKGEIVVNDWLGHLAQEAQNEALYISDIPSNFYSKSLAHRAGEQLSSSGISDLFSWVDTADKGTLLWFIIFDATGGAVGDVAANATAYAHRDALMFYQSYAVDLGDLSNTTKTFLTDFHTRLLSALPNDTYGTYPGYVDPYLTDGAQEYWMANLPQLQSIKSKWDAKDVFHNPQSPVPGAL